MPLVHQVVQDRDAFRARLQAAIDSSLVQVAAVLGYNFPGSEWYQNSYDLLTREGITLEVDPEREDPSYFERAWRRLFG